MPSASTRHHLVTHYESMIDRALAALSRHDSYVRLVGSSDEDEEE